MPVGISSSGCAMSAPVTSRYSPAVIAARLSGSWRHRAGMNVLADKPLIIRREDLPVLEAALNTADE